MQTFFQNIDLLRRSDKPREHKLINIIKRILLRSSTFYNVKCGYKFQVLVIENVFS